MNTKEWQREFNFWIPKSEHKKIQAIANVKNISLAEIVRQSIRFTLKRYKKKELERLVLKHKKWMNTKCVGD